MLQHKIFIQITLVHPSFQFFFARSNAIFLLISRWLELNLIWLCCLYHVIKWGLFSYNWSWLGTSVPLSMVPTSLSLNFEEGLHCITALILWLSQNLHCRSCWPQSHRNMHASASLVLRLKVCTTKGIYFHAWLNFGLYNIFLSLLW